MLNIDWCHDRARISKVQCNNDSLKILCMYAHAYFHLPVVVDVVLLVVLLLLVAVLVRSNNCSTSSSWPSR